MKEALGIAIGINLVVFGLIYVFSHQLLQ